MDEFALLLQGLLENAAARRHVVGIAAPESPSTDYQAGFADGRDHERVVTLALVLSLLTGESSVELAKEADGQAQVDMAFPFELRLVG